MTLTACQRLAVAAWLREPRVGLAVVGDPWRRERLLAGLAAASNARRIPATSGIAWYEGLPDDRVVAVVGDELDEDAAVVLAERPRLLVSAPALASLHPKLASCCGVVIDLPHSPDDSADFIRDSLVAKGTSDDEVARSGGLDRRDAEELAAMVTAFGIADQRIDVATGLLDAALAAGVAASREDADAALVECLLLPRATRIPPEPEQEDEDPETRDSDEEDAADQDDPEQADSPEEAHAPDADEIPPLLPSPTPAKRCRLRRAPAGRRGGVLEPAPSGRAGRVFTTERPDSSVTLAGTLREAARWSRGDGVEVRPEHLRWAYRRRPSGRLTVFVVDASGSMAKDSIRRAKAEAVGLLDVAYQRRDRVAIVLVSGRRATVGLHPTRSAERARHCLRRLPAGGGTPLASGMVLAAELARAWEPAAVEVVLFTDGRANVGLDGTKAGAHTDTERAAALLRDRTGARRVRDLSRRGQGAAWLAHLLA